MNKKSIIAIVAICMLIGILAPTNNAEAKVLKMYIPNAYVKESQQAQGFQAAVDQIKKDTNGRVSIKIYYGGQLCGSYEDAIDECRGGTIDFAATWPTKKYDKRFDLLNLPCFAPLGYKQYGEVMFSKKSIVPEFMNKVMSEVGVVSIGGFPECYTTYSFAQGKRPAKFDGFAKKNRSLRVPGMPPYRDAAVALGYQTVTMDSSEMWNAMQTGQVDGGAASPLEECWFLGRDIVKYIDYNKLCCPPTWIICNKELWATFSDNDKRAITKNFYNSSMKVLANLEKKEVEYMANFKKIGTEIHTYSDAEIVKLHTEIRKKVWPNYYSAIGEEFLRKLDKQVSTTKP